MILHIENECIRVAVDKEIGASVTDFSFRRGDAWIPIMRPAPEPLERSSFANFVMAPYSNRILDGRFRYNDTDFQLRKSEKHAIHGDVRDRPWRLVEQQSERLTLAFDSRRIEEFNFPFQMAADLSYEIRGSEFRSELCITNLDSRVMPAGGGFHPYFLRSLAGADEEVELKFSAEAVFDYEGELPFTDTLLKPLPARFDFSQRKPLVEGLDHGYANWDGKAEMYWPKSGVQLQIEADATVKHLILYTPAGESSFAFEPVSNSTDGFNQLDRGISGTGVAELEAGQSLTIAYSITLKS